MKLVYTLLFFALPMSIFAQIDSVDVPFVAYWQMGDTYDYKITKVKQKWEGETMTKNDTTQYTATFEVLDSTENSYSIAWRYTNNLISTDLAKKLAEKLSKYTFTTVKYSTTELGEFVGIENWEEVRDLTFEALEQATNGLADELSKKELKKFNTAMSPLKEMYNSKEGIEQLVLKELMYFHFPFGAQFSATDTLRYEEEFPNMFGGDPIGGDGLFYFEEVDAEEGYCVMVNSATMNKNDVKEMLQKVFKKMGLRGKELKKEMKEFNLDIQDFNRYEYYYYPGVPVNITTQRTTTGSSKDEAETKQIEKTIIELIFEEE